MTGLRFGPAGNADAFFAAGHQGTAQAFAYLRALGLTAFEYPMGRGVSVSLDTAAAFGQKAREADIAVSGHAPYFINLADPERHEKSLRYILDSARVVAAMGGDRLVVHVGAQKKQDREAALQCCEAGVKQALEGLEQAGLAVRLCLETMGKKSQIGDVQEIVRLCRADERLIPCLDFAHIHALNQGALNTTADFAAALDLAEQGLGLSRAQEMHIHFSKVEYTQAGEKMHRCFADEGFGPDFHLLAPLLRQRGYCGRVICESRGTQDVDACAMRAIMEEPGEFA